jgi:hypothetical protein
VVFLLGLVTLAVPASACVLFILKPRLFTRLLRLSSMKTERDLKYVDKIVQVTGVIGLIMLISVLF